MEKYMVLRNQDVVRNAVNAVLSAPLNELHELVIKPYKPKRSKAQNRLMWKWYGELGDQTGYTKDEFHDYLRKRYLGSEMKTILGKEVEVTPSTTMLTVKGFADYLLRIEQFAAENGFRLTQPFDYRLAIYGEKE